MTSKEAKEKYGGKAHYLTVGKLKKALENYPDDSLIVSQRVEDIYYEKLNWETIKMEDPINEGFEQEYTPVWAICYYGDEFKECVFLDLHY